jgi:hypothetical protein
MEQLDRGVNHKSMHVSQVMRAHQENKADATVDHNQKFWHLCPKAKLKLLLLPVCFCNKKGRKNVTHFWL